MPLDDRDPYWAARFRMTPTQEDELRRRAEATVRSAYDATTRMMAEAGERLEARREGAAAAVDKFRAGVQAEIDKALGRPSAKAPAARPAVQPARPAPSPPTKRDAARDFGAGVLMDRIAESEGTGGPNGYDTLFGYTRWDPPGGRAATTSMTLDELDAYQRDMVARGARSTAAGRYQILRPTALELRGRMGLSGSERFTPELQDRMARERLKMAGYDAFLRGEISAETLQERLSGAWTLIATPSGAPRNSRDPVRTDTATIQSVIASAKAEADHLNELGSAPDAKHPAWR